MCSRKASVGSALVELVVVLVMIAVLLGILLPTLQAAREAARRNKCVNNLRQIGLALHGYHEAHSRFPCGARWKPLNSQGGLGWHVAILPYIEGHSFREDFDFRVGAADSPNVALGELHVPIYDCPSSTVGLDRFAPAGIRWNTTNYAGVMGACGNGQVRSTYPADAICGDYCLDGMLFPDSCVSYADVGDGLSHTLFVGERTYHVRAWLKGGVDEPERQRCVFSSKNLTVPINADPMVFDFDGTPRTVLFNDLFFGSHHPGGACFLMGNGAVEYWSNDLPLSTFRELATIDGGEVVCAW